MTENDEGSERVFDVLRAKGTGPFVILCDHASNRIPPELDDLGLPAEEVARHIAWDIGAAGIAANLSTMFESPAVLCGTSRLAIDCNRHLTAPDLIPEISDGTLIPGNVHLSCAARGLRIERWFEPYHSAVESVLADRQERRLKSIVLSIHSMTASLAGNFRRWQIAISSHHDRTLAQPVLDALRRPGDVVVGDNQPYDLDPAIDYSVPSHAMRRNLPCLQVEFRQDEVGNAIGQMRWAERFAAAVKDALAF